MAISAVMNILSSASRKLRLFDIASVHNDPFILSQQLLLLHRKFPDGEMEQHR